MSRYEEIMERAKLNGCETLSGTVIFLDEELTRMRNTYEECRLNLEEEIKVNKKLGEENSELNRRLEEQNDKLNYWCKEYDKLMAECDELDRKNAEYAEKHFSTNGTACLLPDPEGIHLTGEETLVIISSPQKVDNVEIYFDRSGRD